MNTAKNKKILLVGNPNVGKSVIFNYLTGSYTVISNYPGTTVEISSGHIKQKPDREVIDTPGINSLFPASEDERVTRDILLQNKDAIIVQVIDAKNIYRGLILTTQIAETGCRMILVLNMMDEARQRGLAIDTDALSSLLGVEVIETVAVEKRGLPKLISGINSDKARACSVDVKYSRLIDRAVNEAKEQVGGLEKYDLFSLLTLISGDSEIFHNDLEVDRKKLDGITNLIKQKEEELSEPVSYQIVSARKKTVDSIMDNAVIKKEERVEKGKKKFSAFLPTLAIAAVWIVSMGLFGRENLVEWGLCPTFPVLFLLTLGIALAGTERMDRFTLHPATGYIMVAIVIYLVYKLVGVFAAGTIVDFLENGIFVRFVTPFVAKYSGDGFISDLLVGEFGIVSMGLNYSISIVLPIVVMFFLIFGILEDTGYFPRLTVLTNNGFKMVGVNGKATLPFVLGFGCVTMAVLASRILESRKERIIVVTLLALAVPCSAQLGVMMALMSAISIRAVLLISSIVLAELLVAGFLLGRLLAGKTSDFIIELPPLRVPRVSNIVLKTGARAKWFLKEALPYFIIATLILFTLDRTGGMKIVYWMVEPVIVKFLGLPVETATAFIVGFFRRDYGAAGLFRLWQDGFLSGNQIAVSLVVMSLFLPCLATLIVIIKELGLKIASGIFVLVLAASILSGGFLNYLLTLFSVNI
ncbi:MAG: ferrous iron transport protein B [Candidatus Krumholzibacteriota bacterium]|nr:ferrous iron transport protein B [Candidatus Krumholzibacteriota bacterium]